MNIIFILTVFMPIVQYKGYGAGGHMMLVIQLNDSIKHNKQLNDSS